MARGVPPIPPLPLLQELCALTAFVVDSLDDCVEDVLKLSLLLCVWLGVKGLCGRRGCAAKTRGITVLCICGVLVAYPFVDQCSDAIGDCIKPLQDAVRALSGKARPARATQPPARDRVGSYAAELIDELVEDSAKLACVACHAYMGSLAQSALDVSAKRSSTFAQALAQAAGAILVTGTPAAHYRECDEYSDALGDAASSWVAQHVWLWKTGVARMTSL